MHLHFGLVVTQQGKRGRRHYQNERENPRYGSQSGQRRRVFPHCKHFKVEFGVSLAKRVDIPQQQKIDVFFFSMLAL